MEVLLKKQTTFYDDVKELGIEGLIDTFSSMGGIGRYRCEDYVITGDKDINIFEKEEFKGQWDFEPVLILRDEGEYGSCYFTLYCGNDDYSWFEYVYKWKGSLLRECGKIDLSSFIDINKLMEIKKRQEREKLKEEILRELINSDIWKSHKGE